MTALHADLMAAAPWRDLRPTPPGVLVSQDAEHDLSSSRRGNEHQARAHLARYYDAYPPCHPKGYTGAAFDSWDSTGTRSQDADRFTADDLVAVTFLSVAVPPRAAYILLGERADEFSDLLRDLGPDRELVREQGPLTDGWPGYVLHKALVAADMPGIGPTTASKLVARKRPLLRPIYDEVVSRVIGIKDIWEPLRQELAGGLQVRLEALVPTAGLGAGISVLRVFDVVAWMESKALGY